MRRNIKRRVAVNNDEEARIVCVLVQHLHPRLLGDEYRRYEDARFVPGPHRDQIIRVYIVNYSCIEACSLSNADLQFKRAFGGVCEPPDQDYPFADLIFLVVRRRLDL